MLRNGTINEDVWGNIYPGKMKYRDDHCEDYLKCGKETELFL